MSREVRDLQARVAVLERHAACTVESLHHIRARTSRVLAATSAFAKLQVEAVSLRRAAFTLSTPARAEDKFSKRLAVERKLLSLNGELQQLRATFARELVSAAKQECPRPVLPPARPWWRFWSPRPAK